jgi:hypothetical protein
MTNEQIHNLMDLIPHVDKAVLAHYPNARKIDWALIRDLYYEDGTHGIAYYIIQELPDADEFGRNKDLPEDFEVYGPVALTVWQHDNTGRIFFGLLNEHGESRNSWGETDGEIFLDSPELHFEVSADADVND